MSADESVRVAVRVRPLSSDETDEGCEAALNTPNSANAEVCISATGKRFTFDYAFGPKVCVCARALDQAFTPVL